MQPMPIAPSQRPVTQPSAAGAIHRPRVASAPLLLVLLLFGLLLPALAAALTVEAPAILIDGYELVGEARIGRFLFDYTYEARASNISSTPPYADIQGTLSSGNPATQVIDGDLACGELWGSLTDNSSGPCMGTFTIRHDRRQPLDLSDLSWTISATALDDGDLDGVPDANDNCPAHFNPDQDPQACELAEEIMISGTVTGAGAPLGGVTITLGANSVITTTAPDGSFAAEVGRAEFGNDGTGDFVSVAARQGGWGTGYAKVNLIPGESSYSITLDLLPVSDEIRAEDNSDDGVAATLLRRGEQVGSLEIPRDSFPDGVTQITGTMTYLDPTTDDLASFPGGDFLALQVLTNPDNLDPVTLESLGLMEFALIDQDGNPIRDLAGPATLCMTIPEALRGLVDENEEVPLWYYDPVSGLWLEGGSGFAAVDSDPPQMCGQVSHFTWWNYDRPISTHACFKYHFVDAETGAYIDDLSWRAEGVNWSGGAWERRCQCAAGDPGPAGEFDGPCPLTQIDSLTVARSDQTLLTSRIYTQISGTKYYLRALGNGTYGTTTDAAQAMVVENPTLQGSCFNNSNLQNCRFLDYQEGAAADGVLPLVAPNRAPVIANFGVTPATLSPGDAATVTATITDPEGDEFEIAWSAACWDAGPGDEFIAPEADDSTNAPNFSAIFSAPSATANAVVWCQVQVTATDENGNSSSASRSVVVFQEGDGCEISGILYGPDGAPLPGTQITLERTWVPQEGQDYLRTVMTDANGQYVFDDVPCCDTPWDGFEGELRLTFNQNGQPWEYSDWVWLGCGGGFPVVSQGHRLGIMNQLLGAIDLAPLSLAQAVVEVPPDLSNCNLDIHLPTVWATVQGERLDFGSGNWVRIESGDGSGGEVGGQRRLFALIEVAPGGSYGPVAVPIGRGTFWTEDFDLSQGFDLPAQGQTLAIDLGGTGTVTGIAYLDDGTPAAGVSLTVCSGLWGSTCEEVTTDTAGAYSLDDVTTGWVQVSGSVAGGPPPTFTRFNAAYLNQAGETLPLDLNNTQGCDLTGTLYDVFGQPVVGEQVSIWVQLGFLQQSEITDANGQFSFTGLARTGGVELWSWFFADGINQDIYRHFSLGRCPEGGAAVEVDLPAETRGGCDGGGGYAF